MRRGDITEAEYRLLVVRARERLCGTDPLSAHDSEMQQEAADWFSNNFRAMNDEMLRDIVSGDNQHRYAMLTRAFEACAATDVESMAIVEAEIVECAREVIDGVYADSEDEK